MNRFRKSPLVFVVCVLFLGFDAALILTGCERQPTGVAPNTVQFGDKTLTAPPGSIVTIDTDNDQYQGESIEKREGSINATGAGIETDSQDAILKFNASAPILNFLGLGSADAGATIIDSVTKGKQSTPALLYFGALMFCAGIGLVCFKHFRDGIILCVGGLVLVGASFIGPIGWLVMLVVVAGLVAAFIWLSRKEKHGEIALGTVLSGVEKIKDEGTRKEVKANVASVAAKQNINVGKVIQTLKTKKGLPSERPT